jgi:hypothetical protein
LPLQQFLLLLLLKSLLQLLVLLHQLVQQRLPLLVLLLNSCRDPMQLRKGATAGPAALPSFLLWQGAGA